MKCKRCGNEMKREQAGDHRFIYRCRRCGLIIKGSNDQTPTDDYRKAFQIITGQEGPES